MKKHYNSFAGILTLSVILLVCVIIENILSAKKVPNNGFAQVPAPNNGITDGRERPKEETQSAAMNPPTIPQSQRADVSRIKQDIEKAGLNPVEARYWKEGP